MLRPLIVVSTLLALAGCKDRDNTPPDPQAAADKPAIVEERDRAIERVKAVEQQTLDAQKKVDDAMEGG